MRKHPARCENANPKSICKCRCGGANHGSGLTSSKEFGDIYERTVTERLGGDIALVIKDTTHSVHCNCCGNSFAPCNFFAYPHDGGVADASGKKWWLFVECANCGNHISWKKFKRTRGIF